VSTQAERAHRLPGDDEGFSLVEVIVALSIFAVVAFAALPVLVVGLQASQKARVETLAKDLSQLRIERMRNLTYHVDEQNGPYVDLLDRYYTNASGTATATGETGCTGQYLSTAPGTDGAPSGPAYRVTCVDLPESAGFTQVVYTQFLQRTGVPLTPATLYDSQLDGRDDPPSQLVGVTVLTSWDKAGRQGTLRTYTEIAEAKGGGALVTTQAQALALKVSALDAAAGTHLVAQAGQVKADGSLTSGSVASVQTVGASLEQITASPQRVTGGVGNAVAPKTTSPANPAGDSSTVASGSISLGAGLTSLASAPWVGCGWSWSNKTAYSNASSTTGSGIPQAPSNVGADALASGAAATSAGLLRNGGGCEGYAFGFRNWLTAPANAPGLGLSTARPQVYVLDGTAGGGDLALGLGRGGAAVSATDALTATHDATAVATSTFEQIGILPTVNHPNGLVTATLTSARIACRSGVPVTASYRLTVTYPKHNGAPGERESTTIDYTTGGSVVPALPSPGGISFVEGGSTRLLSDYLQWDVATTVAQDQSGASSIDRVFGVAVPDSVVGNGGFGLQLGSLSCVAADNR
jgi:prepilin-type N-terminal cleavage/methylation domain-containing protein